MPQAKSSESSALSGSSSTMAAVILLAVLVPLLVSGESQWLEGGGGVISGGRRHSFRYSSLLSSASAFHHFHHSRNGPSTKMLFRQGQEGASLVQQPPLNHGRRSDSSNFYNDGYSYFHSFLCGEKTPWSSDNFRGDQNNNNQSDSGKSDDPKSSFDLEETRKRLEDLMRKSEEDFFMSSSPSSITGTTAVPPTNEKNKVIDNNNKKKQNRPNPFSLLDLFFRNDNTKNQTPEPSPSSSSNKSRRGNSITAAVEAWTTELKYDQNKNVNLSLLKNVDLQKSLCSKTRLPLTAMEMERRLAEIQLLTQLQDSNEVVEDLWNLWYQEQGPAGVAWMRQVEAHLTAPQQWPQAERATIQMIQQYGTTWAEPINRLATLYFMQGRLTESEQLCHVVLTIKPWHFGALSGLVTVYASLHQVDKARQWAYRRLPSLQPPNYGSSNQRRQLWVQEAIRQAKAMLQQQLDERGRDFWGPQDRHTIMTVGRTNPGSSDLLWLGGAAGSGNDWVPKDDAEDSSNSIIDNIGGGNAWQ